MEEFNDEVFEFGNNTNEDTEQQSSFNYDSISGLGESNYENEDLFNTEVENEFVNDFRINDFDSPVDINNEIVSNLDNQVENYEGRIEKPVNEEVVVEPTQSLKTIEEETISEPEQPILEEEKETNMELSKTKIEELKKLTEYKEENIETTDINSLFDKVSVNVKDASDIFRKNTDLKRKIDARFEELKKLKLEIENSRKKQLDEINAYKEEVLEKLTEKKEEIEKRLNLLKNSQTTLEKEKQEFETYKKKEQDHIEKVKKEVQTAYDDRREELSHIEDILRKQKDALDEERSQLSLDRIQYETDKNDLANSLLKFNDLVSSFKNGVKDVNE